MEKLYEKINSRYDSGCFINNPTLLKNHEVKVVLYNQLQDKQPLISIVTPVYNQEDIIVKNIHSVFEHTTTNLYEYIIIIDACSDATSKNIQEYFSKKKNYPDNCTRIIVLESHTPLFETSADNIGFYSADGDYVLEIQADMEMTEHGYNTRLLKPFLSADLKQQLIGVSGRCCHFFTSCLGVGKLGGNVEKTLTELKIDKKYLYIGETCNRGPLMLNRKMLHELKYLDEKNFYLDDSDHDLFARAFIEKQWICGYVPIDFSAPLVDGSTRKTRDTNNSMWLNKRRNEGDGGFLLRYKISNIPVRPILKYELF